MSLSVQVEGLDGILADLDALPKQIERAQVTTSRKATQYAKTRLIDLMAEATDIPVKEIRRRVRVGATLAWLGFNPMKAAYVGTLTQNETGAFAGEYFFEGAFVAKMPSGNRGVFKRKGKARLPIAEQAVNLNQGPGIAEKVRGELETELPRIFREEMAAELVRK